MHRDLLRPSVEAGEESLVGRVVGPRELREARRVAVDLEHAQPLSVGALEQRDHPLGGPPDAVGMALEVVLLGHGVHLLQEEVFVRRGRVPAAEADRDRFAAVAGEEEVPQLLVLLPRHAES